MFNFRVGKCVSKMRLDGKTAIITGCNTGIGKVTAKELFRIGAKVIMACRDIDKAKKSADNIRETAEPFDNLPMGELVIRKLDLTSLKSVRECAKGILLTEQRIHLLINNAGVMMCPNGRTEDGFETHFGVNHLGHFLFTCSLLPRIINSKPARIINVSSVGHRYSGVNVYSVHPGVVRTELGRHLNKSSILGATSLIRPILRLFQKTPEQGAQTTIYCAIDETLSNETGCYYSDCKKAIPSANARRADDANKLWNLSAKFVGMENWNPFTAPHDQLPPILQNT